MELKLIATLVVIALSVVLTWIGRRLGQSAPSLDNGLVAFSLLLALWLPQGFRDFALIFIAAMMGLLGGRALAVASGGLAIGLAIWVPGGTIVVLLALCALLAYVSARQERGRLVSLLKAALLVPGEDKQIEVAVLGPATARGVRRPDNDEPVAAWWARVVDGESVFTTASETSVSIETEAGVAKAALAEVEIVATELPQAVLLGEPAKDLAADLGYSPDGEISVTVSWIEQGSSLFVKGVPVWEADREGGSYRDSHFVPVFRATETNPMTLKLGTLAELKNKIIYSIVMWGIWALPCAGIAAVQIALDLG